MNEKRVRIIIDKKGDYELEALDGFSGESCLEKTKDIEIAIGGQAIDDGKTDAYYNSDDDGAVSLKL